MTVAFYLTIFSIYNIINYKIISFLYAEKDYGNVENVLSPGI